MRLPEETQDMARNIQQLLNTANVNNNTWLVYIWSICSVDGQLINIIHNLFYAGWVMVLVPGKCFGWILQIQVGAC
jgi:hypothetical protein